MKRFSSRNLIESLIRVGGSTAACAALLASCGDDGPSGDGGGSQLRPFQDDWEAYEYDFGYLDEMGVVAIDKITVGGTPYMDNFVNRGDVIVNFTGPEGKIKIELRRFTMATSSEGAEADFEALKLWAFNASTTSPKPHGDMEPENDCTANGWLDDCAVRVYYEGQSQLSRAGADIRVTLPESYRHSLEVITQDADSDPDYHNRGNVCVDNARGTVDIDMESGVAYVILNEDTKPMPLCSDEGTEACNNWPLNDPDKPQGSEAWVEACPCWAPAEANGTFGRVQVETGGGAAANVSIDIPSDLWARIALENEMTGQTVSGNYCDANVELEGDYVLDEDQVGTEETRDPWKNIGYFNTPSEAAVQGAGFNINATSAQCAPVTVTEDPADFVGTNNGSTQLTCARGDLSVCSGCLRGTTCDELLAADRIQSAEGCSAP